MREGLFVVRLEDPQAYLHAGSEAAAASIGQSKKYLYLCDTHKMHFWEFELRQAMCFTTVAEAEAAAINEHNYIAFRPTDTVYICNADGSLVKKLKFGKSLHLVVREEPDPLEAEDDWNEEVIAKSTKEPIAPLSQP